ncbi:transformer-2 protein homolog alpha isoform X3 [Protopterus annectens]|uniref:transformer-2 protein homolog alpha isoform X3 n=1 Tax=Protopterus annectens TaxID=7888 RepID=UPI001CFB0EE7|nr:transformer-2 protein homolog alpha isoform X3 [Protopterus annectens]
MSDVEENNFEGRASRSRSKSPARSPARAKSRSRSASRSPSRTSKRSESHSRSRSKSRSRSRRHSHRHYSRSRSRSRSHRRRSRSRSYSPDYRRRRSRSHSPMSSRRRHASSRVRGVNTVLGGSRTQGNPEPNTCLGVFGLSLYTTERDLREVFSRYGPLAGVNVVYDQRTGRSRGFAFVYFERLEDAKEAMERANGMELDGRRIRVDYSITKRAHTPTPGIYMGRPTQRRSPSPYYSRYRSRSRSRSYSPRRY